jgi:hypothetical protein
VGRGGLVEAGGPRRAALDDPWCAALLALIGAAFASFLCSCQQFLPHLQQPHCARSPLSPADSHFWAAWADHLAAAAEAGAPPGPFLPEDLTEAPATVASGLAGLAALGLRMAGEPGSGGGGGALRAARGGDGGVTLTAAAPAIVFTKQTARVAGGGGGAAAAGGVIVAERIYKAGAPTWEDPETGEEVGASFGLGGGQKRVWLGAAWALGIPGQGGGGRQSGLQVEPASCVRPQAKR